LELTPGRPSRVPAILQGIVRPLLAGLLVASAGVGGWWVLIQAENRVIDRLVETETRLVAAQIERTLRMHLVELEQMARRWERRTNAAADDWKADVLEVKRQTPAFRAIEWREPALTLRWAAPLTALGRGGDLDSLYEDRRLAALSLAGGTNVPYVSATYYGSVEHRHVSVVAPMFDGESVNGYLIGVVRVRDLLDESLHQELKNGYSIAVHEGPYLLYGPEPTTEGRDAERFSRFAEVEVEGLKWKVEAWPGRQLTPRLRSPAALVVLVIGVMFGVFAAAVVSRPPSR